MHCDPVTGAGFIVILSEMKESALRKLNVGCGRDVRSGWVNLDAVALPGVDVVHDLATLPLPFQDSEFDVIGCQDVLEHLDYVPVLRELYRILKTGGELQVRVPHFTSRNNFVDPTHRRQFSVDTWEFFGTTGGGHMAHLHPVRAYYFDFCFASIVERKITFETGSALLALNGLVEKWVNRTPRRQALYESSVLSRLFPAENIEIRLRK